MAEKIKHTIKYNHYFDQKTNTHYINGFQVALHCHHYTTLYTQLAIDSGETDLLKDCARDTFRKLILAYFENNPEIKTLAEKVKISCEYYSLLGLGKMKVIFMGDYSGKVEITNSHIDSGWIKKWGYYDRPVNYIGAGFIEAMFETILGFPEKTFLAEEIQSIVTGSEKSLFKISRR